MKVNCQFEQKCFHAGDLEIDANIILLGEGYREDGAFPVPKVIPDIVWRRGA